MGIKKQPNNNMEKVIVEFLNGSGQFYAYFLTRIATVKDRSYRYCFTSWQNGVFTLHYNDETFNNSTIEECCALVEHEVLHVVNNHFKRGEPYSRDVMNIAADCAINQKIHGLPKGCVTVDTVAQMIGLKKYDLESAREMEYYADLLQQKRGGIIESLKKMLQESGCSLEQQPCDNTSEQQLEIEGIVVKSAEASGYSPQKDKTQNSQPVKRSNTSQGRVPTDVKRLVDTVTSGARLNWKQLLKQRCSQGIPADHRRTWKRLRRRSEQELKGKAHNYVPRVVVAVDTSGSIYGMQSILEQFSKQLNDIRAQYGGSFTVIECDADIQKEYVMRQTFKVNHEYSGGGGTDFTPVFERCDNVLKPHVLVYLTDGYGEFPECRPKYKTVWCSTELEPSSYPFGDVVMLPKDDK